MMSKCGGGWGRQGSISPTCLRAAFTCADPKSAKMTHDLTVLFALLESTSVIAASKILMKSTPGFSFVRAVRNGGHQIKLPNVHIARSTVHIARSTPLLHIFSLSHTPSHSLTISFSHYFSISLSLSLSLSLYLTLSISLILSLILSLYNTPSHALSHSHSISFFLTLYLSMFISLSYSFSPFCSCLCSKWIVWESLG